MPHHYGHREDAEEVRPEIVLRVCKEACQLMSPEQARADVVGIGLRVCAAYDRRNEAGSQTMKHIRMKYESICGGRSVIYRRHVARWCFNVNGKGWIGGQLRGSLHSHFHGSKAS